MASRTRNTSVLLSSTSTTGVRASPLRRSCSGLDSEEEGGPLSRLGFDPDASAIPFDDPLADGEPHPRSGVSIVGVESLKDPKNSLLIFRPDANSVVLDREQPMAVLPDRSYVDDKSPLTAIFNCVPNKILKELLQMDVAYLDARHIGKLDAGAAFANRLRQIGKRRFQRLPGVGRCDILIMNTRSLSIGKK